MGGLGPSAPIHGKFILIKMKGEATMDRMHLGNLPWRLSDEQLRKLFGRHGPGDARSQRIQVVVPDRFGLTVRVRPPAYIPPT